MKRFLLSSLLASSLYADLSITQTENSIIFDGSEYLDNMKYMFLYKNDSYFKALTNTATYSIDLETGRYKAIVLLDNNQGIVVNTFEYIAPNDVRNIAPELDLKMIQTDMGMNFDLTGSVDTDGYIASYNAYIYDENGKFTGNHFNSTTALLDLEPGEYKIIVVIKDDDGEKTLKTFYFTVEAPQTTNETDETINGPDYTLGTPSVVVKSNIKSSEYYYRFDFHDNIGSWAAYEQGWTGEGVQVAVIDSGIDTDHTDLDDNIASVNHISSYTSGEDDYRHGTMVAGVIAAEKNDYGIHGVAYDADIHSIKVLNKYGGGTQNGVAAGVDIATSLGVKVSNLSLGSTRSGDISSYISAYNEAILADNSIIVAAGNEGTQCTFNGTSFSGCHFPAALPLVDPTLLEGDGAWIVVGSSSSNGTISDFSNTAGLMKDFFMVAPAGSSEYGELITTTGIEDATVDGTWSSYGTSFAAPMVTGAFALLSQKYPYLVGTEIRDILFASATDLGEEGVDDIFGHGELNIEKAMAPIGELKIPVGTTVNSQTISVTNTSMLTSSSIGLDLTNLPNIVTLDSYNRGYSIDVSAAQTKTEYKYDIDDYAVMTLGDFGMNNTLLALNQGTQNFALGHRFKYADILFGMEDGVFGSTGTGATELSGDTYYTTINTNFKSFDFGLTYGYSNPNVGGMFKNISSVHGVSAKIGYTNGGFSIGVKSPMAVVSGSIDVEAPTVRAMDGSIGTETSKLSMIGSRETELYVSYTVSF